MSPAPLVSSLSELHRLVDDVEASNPETGTVSVLPQARAQARAQAQAQARAQAQAQILVILTEKNKYCNKDNLFIIIHNCWL